ncbi:MAG: hypothetical protein B7Z81_04480 [Acidocella sp. 20-61-6]|nr:MAG: hypothetical protein B7Z81_04480 [Acidocella sp. 20-61-6]
MKSSADADRADFRPLGTLDNMHAHGLTFLQRRQTRLLKRGGVDKIRRAVLLIRDPFDSIFRSLRTRRISTA